MDNNPFLKDFSETIINDKSYTDYNEDRLLDRSPFNLNAKNKVKLTENFNCLFSPINFAPSKISLRKISLDNSFFNDSRELNKAQSVSTCNSKPLTLLQLDQQNPQTKTFQNLLEEILNGLKEIQESKMNYTTDQVEKVLKPLQAFKFKRKFDDTLKRIAVTAMDLLPDIKVAKLLGVSLKNMKRWKSIGFNRKTKSGRRIMYPCFEKALKKKIIKKIEDKRKLIRSCTQEKRDKQFCIKPQKCQQKKILTFEMFERLA